MNLHKYKVLDVIGDIKNVDTETIKSLTVDIAEGESTTR